MFEFPKSPAGQRLQALLTLVNDPTPLKIAPALDEIFSPTNRDREPVEKRIATIMGWHSRGGFDVIRTVEAGDFALEVVARHPFTDEYWRLAVELQIDRPHRIDALLLGRSPMPMLNPDGSDQDVADRFVGYTARLASVGLFSGAVLIARRGRILGQAAFGMANRDFEVPNRIDTRFDVASLCKMWTAVAICQKIEAGHFAFETPVSDFIDYPTKDAAKSIEIRHLLSHTSGLGSYFTEEFFATSRQRYRSIDDFLELTKDQIPEFAPGTASKYSNTGMVLLGKVLEIVSGQDYFDTISSSVLKKAGMTGAGFPELDFVNPGTAVGYNKIWTRGGARIANTMFEGAIRGGPAGCGYATVGDIFRFSKAFTCGDLVSRDMVDLMTSAKPELASPHYGYGFAIHPERALFGHSGGLVGASANLDITRTPAGWVVVVLANDLSMRAPVLKARQLIGVSVPEADEARSYLPRGGMTLR